MSYHFFCETINLADVNHSRIRSTTEQWELHNASNPPLFHKLYCFLFLRDSIY